MTRTVRVSVNDREFHTPIGEVLLDGALRSGIEMPHECRSGRCGSCLVRLTAGRTLGGRGPAPDLVHACQTRVLTDIAVSFEEQPSVVSRVGEIVSLNPLGCEAVEAVVRLAAPLRLRAGQYCNVAFKGFPVRAFSPTPALDAGHDPHVLRFHIKILPDGQVSGALGHDIKTGHKVVLAGPYGSAAFQPQRPSRLVLFASGTGFAPIWSIADAALWEWHQRPMVIVAGARSADAFYMTSALSRIAHYCPQVEIIGLTREPPVSVAWLRQGQPEDCVALIKAGDVVHAAGAPRMVDEIAQAAAAAGAEMHADAFHPSSNDTGLRQRLEELADWVKSVGRKPHTGPMIDAGADASIRRSSPA